MASTSAICLSWKRDLGIGKFNHTNGTGHTFRIALFTAAASLGANTTVYSATNEVSGTGYVAKGEISAPATPVLSGSTVVYDWADVTWAAASFTARTMMMLDDSAASDESVFILDFGGDQVVSSGNFVISFPTADASTAIIRMT